MESNRTYIFNEDQWMIAAEQLRQYYFCKRIPFFRSIRKIRAPTTYLMKKGSNLHDNIIKTKLGRKNLLSKYYNKREKPQQFHNYFLESSALHLLGIIDLFEKNQGDIYPVEIKTGPRPPMNRNRHHLIQLTAQTLLLEEHFHIIILHAKIIYLGSEEAIWVEITYDMKAEVLRAIKELHEIFYNEELPQRTSHRGKCQGCEYWKSCLNA